MMRYWGVVFCFCLWGWGVQGQPEVALKQLLETPGLNHAAIGISVKKVGDGTTVLAHQAGMALTPASVTKLLPTVFALQERGKDFRFKTRVGYTGKIQDGTLTGDLILVAAGDPTLESRYFPNHSLLSPIVTALEKAGIQRIDGSIRVEGALPGVNIPGSWTWEDVSNYYAALYLPFNYRDNTCFYHFQTGVAGTPAKLKEIVPALPGVKIVNEVTAAAGNRDDARVFGGPYSEVLCIRGTLPQNRTLFKVKGAIHRPAEVFVAELTDILKARGITVAKKKIEEQPRTEWLTLTSPELGEIVFHTNKASVNLFAEALGCQVAPADWPEKVGMLLKEAGIPAEGMILKDACGLSPMDAVPASVFTDLLVYADKVVGETLGRSLPVAGKDGGLSGYCIGATALKGRMQAKTGSMSGVRCLAGYLTTTGNERMAFTVLINHYTCTASQLQKAVGKFLQSLLSY